MNKFKGSSYDTEDALLEVGSSSPSDELNLKMQQAQEQLLQLRRQQEEIEEQKRALEELTRKQREFDEGRRDILEKLTRGVVMLEQQEHDMQRESESLRLIRESFSEQLVRVQELQPESWSSQELPTALTRALATIDQAQAAYTQSRPRLEALRVPGTSEDEGVTLEDNYGSTGRRGRPFFALVRDGFAYSLPILVLGIVYLFTLLSQR